jgi:hypothetical protein
MKHARNRGKGEKAKDSREESNRKGPPTRGAEFVRTLS